MTASEITPIGGMNGAGFHGGYSDILYQIVGQPLGVSIFLTAKELLTTDMDTTSMTLPT